MPRCCWCDQRDRYHWRAERLERERLRRGQSAQLADRLMEIGKHCAALPDIDTRSPDEIVGYDETGMWR